MFKTLTRTLILATAAVSLAGAANAKDYSFKFQSSDAAGSPNFALQKDWAKNVKKSTDGQVTINLLPVDSIVSHSETQDAIQAGILDGHITDVSYFSGKDPAFGLIANPVGAWSDPQNMLDFMSHQGGKLMTELDSQYGLHFIGATTPGLEALVSKVPLNGVADLKGVKIRAPEGLVQNVFAAAGAAPVNLPQSEIYTSLDKGVIDAADATVFSTNQELGLNTIAPNPVYPGFHSLPLVEIAMNKKEWDDLPEKLQTTLTKSVHQFAQHELSVLQKRDQEAVEKAKATGKIHIHDWSDAERAKFRKIAEGEWKKVATKSDNAQKVYDTLTSYLKEKGLLKE
ncbi:TRAP transporter substrate-binding protein [Pararhizobium mangrovi]|uniref:TRAP transporter substrate-binding protein n=1 Tax=Pararhizobium mangrovi TaxID=2590452 RepID=UPI001F27596D|nr:TRAP transporter substrate-binding protein [Pararhizobium mangrovi]